MSFSCPERCRPSSAGHRVLLVLLVLVLTGAGSAAGQPADTATADSFEGFDRYVESAMETWQVPGLAVAAVEDGEIVLARGYGHRQVEEERPVTPHTLFAIGSNTKSFTATILGILVDEGELDWETPVREYLPRFRLASDVATDQMTAGDLVTHRSGLPRHDLLWYGSNLTREQMFRRLRHLEPSEPFRAEFQYNNLMFMTAGYLAGRVAGASWEELVDRRLLTPLGMDRSNFSVSAMQEAKDFARPYAMRDSQVVRIPYRNIDEIGPAGSINSSAREMARYVQAHLDGGLAGGLGSDAAADTARLLSTSGSRAMQRPQMVTPDDPEDPELGYPMYGRGLMVGSYRGHELVGHGGGIDGFISRMAWLPQDSAGVVVLTNFSGDNPVPQIVARNVFDRLLGLEPIDWAGRIEERQGEDEESEEEAEAGPERVKGTSPSHELADYAGRYEHSAYGTFAVEANDSTLTYEFNDFSGPLSHFHYDVFRAAEEQGNPLSEKRFKFQYDRDGGIDRLSVSLEPEVDDIVFERAPAERLTDAGFLSRLTGKYRLGDETLEIKLRGETLVLSVAGQAPRELVPGRGTSFDLEGLEGYGVEFVVPESGPATKLRLQEPNGTKTATRE